MWHNVDSAHKTNKYKSGKANKETCIQHEIFVMLKPINNIYILSCITSIFAHLENNIWLQRRKENSL